MRCDHLTNRAGSHNVADPDRLNVRAALIHPAAHGGIQRYVLALDYQLARAGIGHGLFRELPVSTFGQTNRSGGKAKLTVCWHGEYLYHNAARQVVS
jgi:hypothetical protein